MLRAGDIYLDFKGAEVSANGHETNEEHICYQAQETLVERDEQIESVVAELRKAQATANFAGPGGGCEQAHAAKIDS